MKRFTQDSAKRAVIAVGSGRGFIMEAVHRLELNGFPRKIRLSGTLYSRKRAVTRRIVVTAAHCLPHLPPAHANAFAHEKTYAALLGPLGDSNPSIMAECLFVDPVADIAVLGEPDAQAMSPIVDKEEDLWAFETFTDGEQVLRLGDMPTKLVRGWLLSLDGRWTKCTVAPVKHLFSHGLRITEATEGIVDGMSGSPILLDDGRAIGVVCTSVGTGTGPHTSGGPQPQLSAYLPGWLLQELRTRQKAIKE